MHFWTNFWNDLLTISWTSFGQFFRLEDLKTYTLSNQNKNHLSHTTMVVVFMFKIIWHVLSRKKRELWMRFWTSSLTAFILASKCVRWKHRCCPGVCVLLRTMCPKLQWRKATKMFGKERQRWSCSSQSHYR